MGNVEGLASSDDGSTEEGGGAYYEDEGNPRSEIHEEAILPFGLSRLLHSSASSRTGLSHSTGHQERLASLSETERDNFNAMLNLLLTSRSDRGSISSRSDHPVRLPIPPSTCLSFRKKRSRSHLRI